VGPQDVPPEALDGALGRVFREADREPQLPLTYFEAITAAAMVLFRDSSVDLAVLEVGLGGRLDATNVAPASLSIVTSIAFDHMAELGDTLPEIAREKAGIFRRGRPALVRAEDPAALAALASEAERAGAQFHDAARELRVHPVSTDADGTEFDLETPLRRGRFRTPLPGAHQAWNAALAIRAAELIELSELVRPAASGPGDLSTETLARGLSEVRWGGRLERLTSPRGRAVLLDGCHNPDGARALARFLKDAGIAGRSPLVFGAMADKDVEGIAAALFPEAGEIVLVPAPGPRAASPEELLRRTAPFARAAATAPDVVSAVAMLDGVPEARDAAPIIVAGSLYLVGEARAVLLRR
jgi:dihydrofolate synthase/folylpolyglutamate synthase